LIIKERVSKRKYSCFKSKKTGMSLGTPYYMAPEQAMGEREITPRADVYALGCVCYEMLCGEPPFTGPTAQAIVARVITEEPRGLTLRRKSIPPALEAAILTALEKLPADRFASAAEFAAALAGDGTASRRVSGQGAAPSAAAPRGRIVPVAVAATAAALGLLGIAFGTWNWLRARADAEVSRQRVVLWQHPLDDFLSPGLERHATQAAIAPDGSSIVFTDSIGGTSRLLRKLRGEAEATLLAGTERAASPFFSPDGAWVGYVTTDGQLRKLPAAGGGSITLAANVDPTYTTAAWQDDGTILYLDEASALRRIPADGGSGTVVLRESAGQQRRTTPLITPLPGSRGVLLTTCPGNCAIASAIAVLDLATGTVREVVADAAGAWYSPTGHLLYTARGGGLYAAGFDPRRLALTTGPVPVIPDVAPTTFALSTSGSALYSLAAGAAAPSTLVWVSRDGRSEPLDPEWRGQFEYPAISPDGKAIAVSLRDGTTQLWIWRSDGTRQKLAEEGTVNWRPSWTGDSRSLAFASNRRGGSSEDDFDLYLVPVDASARSQLLQHHSSGLWESEISRDGAWLVMRSDEPEGSANIYARRLTGDTTLVPLVVDKSSSTQVALSPDGRWLAYASDATGRFEIYVTPFPGGGSTRLVSRDGGTEPRWAHSGRELFYRSGGRLMAIAVTPGATLGIGVPVPLFSLAGYRAARNRPQYDVAPGDQRFLMVRLGDSGARRDAVYVDNWFGELRARMARR
jgi:serine/threonine-protein kinase